VLAAARGVLAAATPLVRSVRRRRGGAGCWPSRGAVDRRRRDVERPRAMGPRRRGAVDRRAALLGVVAAPLVRSARRRRGGAGVGRCGVAGRRRRCPAVRSE